jgi:hypothetical protein
MNVQFIEFALAEKGHKFEFDLNIGVFVNSKTGESIPKKKYILHLVRLYNILFGARYLYIFTPHGFESCDSADWYAYENPIYTKYWGKYGYLTLDINKRVWFLGTDIEQESPQEVTDVIVWETF